MYSRHSSQHSTHSSTNLYQAFYHEQATALREEIRKFQTHMTKENDINLTIMGPSAEAKRALIRTFIAAYHNNQDRLPDKPAVQGGWVCKTGLTRHKKYTVQGSKNQLQRRNINFLEYCQTVNSKTIANFSKLFQSILVPHVLTPSCGPVFQNTLPNPAKTTVFCFESGIPLSEDEYCYISLMIANLQQQNLEPIIVIVNLFEPVKWINELSAIERKQMEIKKFANGFNISRDQVYLLQCYRQDSALKDQTNFYALQLLLALLRQYVKSEKESQVKPRTRIASCF